MTTNPPGDNKVFSDTVTPTEQHAVFKLWHATSAATSADEQAVSMLMLGPSRPRAYEMRFEIIDPAAPVAVYGPADCSVPVAVIRGGSELNSATAAPPNTPTFGCELSDGLESPHS